MMHCYPHPSQQPPYHPQGGHKGMRMAGWGDRQFRKNKKRVWGQDLAFFAPQNMRFGLKWVLMVRQEFILRQGGGIWLRIIFEPFLTPQKAMKDQKIQKNQKKLLELSRLQYLQDYEAGQLLGAHPGPRSQIQVLQVQIPGPRTRSQVSGPWSRSQVRGLRSYRSSSQVQVPGPNPKSWSSVQVLYIGPGPRCGSQLQGAGPGYIGPSRHLMCFQRNRKIPNSHILFVNFIFL